jgi:hypothetical protein
MRLRSLSVLFAGLLATLAAVLATSGCGSSASTIDPVAQAADTTAHAGGARVAIGGGVSLPSGAISLGGGGEINFAAGEAELTLLLGGLPSQAQSVLHTSSLQMTEVYKSTALYMTSPLFSGRLPGGASWIKLDLGRVRQALGLDPSSITSQGINPSQYLQELSASGGSRVVGHEKLRGVDTTHYAGKLDLLKAAEHQAGGNPARAREAFSKLTAAIGTTSIPVDVWVDGQNRVRKFALALTPTAQGQTFTFKLDIEYFDFGPTVAVKAPSSGEVFDVTERSLSALSGLG